MADSHNVSPSFRARHVRATNPAALKARVTRAMRQIRSHGGRIADLKLSTHVDDGGERVDQAIIVYETDEGTGQSLH